jgi:CRP-like cAMP-binding protein
MAQPSSHSTVEKVLFLKSVAIFEHVAVEELGRIAMLAETAQFDAGAAIYHAGDPVEWIYILQSGQAAVQQNGVTVRQAGARQAIGLLAAFDSGTARGQVIAMEPVQALKLNMQDFQDLLASDFELVKAVVRAVVGTPLPGV